MQNSQEMNWWLEVVKIAVPSLIALIIPFIASYFLARKMKDYENILSRKLENYKKDINKELYEFQTKFSFLHQKRAEKIEELHGKLVDIIHSVRNFEIFLLQYEAQRNISEAIFNGWSNELLVLEKDFDYVVSSYTKSRIYFEDGLCAQIEAVMASSSKMIGNFELREHRGSLLKRLGQTNPEQFRQMLQLDRQNYREFLEIAPMLQKTLETEFRKTLSSQIQNFEPEDKLIVDEKA